MDDAERRVLRNDYDTDPARWAANQQATSRFVARDIHADVADGFAAHTAGPVLDVGGGNGVLARLLGERGVGAVVVDAAGHVADAPRPGVRGDACHLPFRDGTFAGAAALWMLYHVAEPVAALAEVRRVLRPGARLAVAVPSRFNDPELASVLPGWGQPWSFDAENGVEQLESVFPSVEVQRWDVPIGEVPDRAALEVVLRGRGLSAAAAADAAGRFDTPLTITKRGMLAWAAA
ncbi:class I SAM-dependent methyltransferase [Pseudonocardia sp. TRM90224]|uniref:class I SAM-dependent methyltransferase n=1 Tax=Pseudonocardia sp. TRM90224 TaxID=2812678 RepID=UPI001E57861E|nr:class I SAM-dependent methyltransferase [Pseudonocardia sp. TRM90224]